MLFRTAEFNQFNQFIDIEKNDELNIHITIFIFILIFI